MSDDPLSERSHYDAFVQRSITELQRGLDLDDTSAKDGVSKAVSAVLQHSKTDAAHKVLCARFALGGDDAAYLQSGLAVLWSTVARSPAGDDLTLAPAALYSPDAVGGIRRGLLRALEAKHKEVEENAADNLAVLVNALRGMLDVPTLQGYAGELGSIRDKDGLNHAALAQGLCKLKGALDKNASGDLAASILDRVNCLTELIKTRARAARAKAEASALEDELEAADANAEAFERASAEAALKQALAEERQKVAEGKQAEAEGKQATAEGKQATAEGKQATAEAERDQAKKRADEQTESALLAWYNVERLEAYAATSAAKLEALERKQTALNEALSAAEAKSNRDSELIAKLKREIGVAKDQSRVTQLQAVQYAQQVKQAMERLQEEKDALQEKFADVKAEYEKLNETQKADVQNSALQIAQVQIDQNSEEWKTKLMRMIASFTFLGLLGFIYVWGLLQENKNLVFQISGMENGLTCTRNAFTGLGQICYWDDPLPSGEPSNAPHDDPHVATVLVRGLVGQRGPTEPATTAAAADTRLAYALPPPAPLAKSLPVARALLERLPAPAEHEVDAALAALAKPLPTAAAEEKEGEMVPAAKRTCVLALPKPTPASVLHGALAEFGDNFAVIGATPAAEKDARAGIEPAHEVRWLPQGPRAATMARAAVLEHAIARCGQLLEDPGVAKQPAIAQAVRDAAAALKLQQLEPLYALHEAVAFDDAPHPLGTAAPLVTRPCAVVRGALAYPIDAGVVPVPPGCKPSAHNAEADVKGAMDATKGETATLRNALRREGVAANVYVAPPAEKLGYEAVPRVQTMGGAEEEAASLAARRIAALQDEAQEARIEEMEAAATQQAAKVDKLQKDMATQDARSEEDKNHELRNDLAAAATSEVVYATDFALPTLRRLVNQCIVTLAAVKHGGGGDGDDGCATSPIGAFLQEQRMQDGGGGVDANDRREALWTEFHRHLSISQDRLWVFVRLLSGGIGGDVNEIITMADEASQQATKALQAQRVEVAKRVSDTQSKIVESVVGAMLKESRLALDAQADNLVVMDAEARKDARDLMSGASGRPFFEANVACRHLKDNAAKPMQLSKLLSSLAAVGTQMQRSLDTALTQPGLASASLVELSHPSNCFFIAMKTDASAAVRIAHERCNSELATRGVGRSLALWELIEGGCTVLTTRFAEFAGHILVQNRASTGVSAMYISRTAIETNAIQARVTLARLTNAAEVYAARVARPAFGVVDASDVGKSRRVAMDEGARVREMDVSRPRPRGDSRVGYGHLYSERSASGWWVR